MLPKVLNLKKKEVLFFSWNRFHEKFRENHFRSGMTKTLKLQYIAYFFSSSQQFKRTWKIKLKKLVKIIEIWFFFFCADSLSKHHELMLKNKVGALVHTYIIKHRWWFFAQLRVSLSWSKASNKSSSHAQGHFTAGFTSFFF